MNEEKVVKLSNIWIENEENPNKPCIRIDWDNNRHHRIQIKGKQIEDMIKAFEMGLYLLKEENEYRKESS